MSTSDNTPECPRQAGTDDGGESAFAPEPGEAEALARHLSGARRLAESSGAFTLLALALIAAAYFAWKYDRMPGSPPYALTLAEHVQNQAVKDFAALRGLDDPQTPVWPLVAYGRLRGEAYLAAGFALLSAMALLWRERARNSRRQLLAYRALARETELLRRRVETLEGAAGTKSPTTPPRRDSPPS